MNITQGLRRALQMKAGGIAVLEGDKSWTWGEVGARVARLAGALHGLGIGDGDRVAVLAMNSARYLELYLGTAWAGGVIVPLNIRWSVLENTDALQDSGAKVLFVDQAFMEAGQALAQALPDVRLVYADDGTAPAGMADYEALLAAATPVADAMRGRDDLAGIFYTGGTTGRSKGVMLSHGNLVTDSLHALAEGMFSPTGTYLHAAPMFHLANGAAMYAMLLGAGTNVIVRAFSPEAVMDAIARHRVTQVLLVPTMVQMLVDHPAMGSRDLSSLERILYGASPMSEAVLDRTAAALPHVEFMQAYGMTELSPIATLLPPEEHVAGRAKGRHRSAGRAAIGVDVRIVDEDDNEVPRGTIGEIVARGANVMMGYWNRPEETAKAVVDGWMHTGDGGYMDEDGFVYVVDRIKDMIISGGENIYSTEVENTVAQYPGVLQCAVIGIPDERWGEAVHAIIVVRPDAEIDPAQVIAFCKERIAGYKCPRSVEARTEPLPMSGAGKILKRDLRQPFWQDRNRRVA
ncbi:long-chain-fatty-acid--CoA ligase [Chelatococcus reniformis]|uniref:3-methylmercaptopropionyl-CoA ligase n=1 Tax=Chelatococcus reniformis TaxID=1494448 RepID=A0A916XLY0_9HYPH|nr:long-chain-fatty-acid--CoA ligase [Chelatococcus reniformis]GGC82480.1 fatty-acid--CoA ligase [Chelatococcus reniformis]